MCQPKLKRIHLISMEKKETTMSDKIILNKWFVGIRKQKGPTVIAFIYCYCQTPIKDAERLGSWLWHQWMSHFVQKSKSISFIDYCPMKPYAHAGRSLSSCRQTLHFLHTTWTYCNGYCRICHFEFESDHLEIPSVDFRMRGMCNHKTKCKIKPTTVE